MVGQPLLLVFLFQAEERIRDGHVTGVQTCALPIWSTSYALALPENAIVGSVRSMFTPATVAVDALPARSVAPRLTLRPAPSSTITAVAPQLSTPDSAS